MHKGNLETDLPDASADEIAEELSAMAGGRVVVERIISEGQASEPGFWYDQEWDEWVLVLRGAAEVEFDCPAGTERLGRGDWLFIPARRRHRVKSTEQGTLWLAVHAGRKP